jgi:hypothetical protein
MLGRGTGRLIGGMGSFGASLTGGAVGGGAGGAGEVVMGGGVDTGELTVGATTTGSRVTVTVTVPPPGLFGVLVGGLLDNGVLGEMCRVGRFGR